MDISITFSLPFALCFSSFPVVLFPDFSELQYKVLFYYSQLRYFKSSNGVTDEILDKLITINTEVTVSERQLGRGREFDKQQKIE